jgi:UDP-2-acetamido-2,6-beta-L-arabino-hexul-4-ose reductase
VKIAITGAGGLVGRHARYLLRSRGLHDQVPLGRGDLDDPKGLAAKLEGCDAVWHIAGHNRAGDAELEQGNIALATQVNAALDLIGSRAAVLYASSIQAVQDSPYGRGKRHAGEVLGGGAARRGARYVDLVLPNIFGEGGRPFYNTVVATFCHQLAHGETPTLNAEGRIELVHAGEVAERFLAAQEGGTTGTVRVEGTRLSVVELWDRLREMAESYRGGVLPGFRDPLGRALFNTYRYPLFPAGLTHSTPVHADDRGELREVIRETGPGQFFVSSTRPGKVRGRHWHRYLIERFFVVQGEALVRLRPVLGTQVTEVRLTAGGPQLLDIPTLHVHEVENTGAGELIMAFWSDKHYDPAASDHYPEAVLL